MAEAQESQAVNILKSPTGKPVPLHIRPESVVDYDVYGDHRYAEADDIHLGIHRLSQEVGFGIFWTPRNGGHWCINDHELIFEASRRPDLFSSHAMTIPPMPEGHEPRFLPLNLDPPEHGPFRMPLMKAFSPDAMNILGKDIRAFATELVDAVADKGECDFVSAIAEPMPVIIFMKLMGMPLDRLHEFRGWVFDMVSNDDARRIPAYAHINQVMDALIREREAERRNDLISRLIDAEIGGRRATFDEVQRYCLLLFAAGLDTVANSLSFGMNHMAGDPALQQRLHAEPGLIPEAIEEFLRKFSVSMPPRTAAVDFEFGGVEIRKGERVMLMLPAGNYDPKIFPDPLEFDLDRENKVHITFNSGPHRCIGSHLARMELRCLYEEWFKRIPPNVRHHPERPRSFRSGLTLAMDALPIVWDMPN
jgi:cytochrome P450